MTMSSQQEEVPPAEVEEAQLSLQKDDNKPNSPKAEEDVEYSKPSGCCKLCRFDGLRTAKAYNILGAGRGCLVMSNIFLATALTYLASEEVGCLERDENGDLIAEEDCQKRVFGLFKPASLVSNIAVIWGLLSALLMPVTGAAIDYTPYRRRVGIGSAICLVTIQAVTISASSKTWVAMALMQALLGFFYQVQNLCAFSFFPSIAATVGQAKMTNFSSLFTMTQFSAQASFLLVVVVVSFSLGLKDVNTAKVSQALSTLVVGTTFYTGWKLLPQVPAKHTVPEGKSIWTQGFVQNWQTAKRINRQYRNGLRWFLLSVVFGEAAANAFTIVSVVFLDETLGLSGSEVGIFFFVALIAMVPGGMICKTVTARINPKKSTILSMAALFVVASVGALSLDKDTAFPYSYIWGFAVGLCLGWFYPVEKIFLSMVAPPSMEAEIAGFYVYCTQILGWLPPLVFSVLVENDIERGIAVVCISAFLLISISILMFAAAPWEEILEEVAENDNSNATSSNSDGIADEKKVGVLRGKDGSLVSITENDFTERKHSILES